jgi:hypothetical protein
MSELRAVTRQAIEMVDGRVYFSDDGWASVWKARLGGLGGGRLVIGEEADRVRFSVAMGAAHGIKRETRWRRR